MDIIWDDALDLNHETNRDSLVPLGRFAPAVHSLLVASGISPPNMRCCRPSWSGTSRTALFVSLAAKPQTKAWQKGDGSRNRVVTNPLSPRHGAPFRLHLQRLAIPGRSAEVAWELLRLKRAQSLHVHIQTLRISKKNPWIIENSPDSKTGCRISLLAFQPAWRGSWYWGMIRMHSKDFQVFSIWKSVTKVGRNLTSSARKRRKRKRRKELHWKVNFSVPSSAVPACWAGEIWRPERGRQPGTWVIGHIVWSHDIFGSKKIQNVPWLLGMEGLQPAGFYGRPRETTTGCHQARSLPMAMPTWSAHWMLVPTGHSTICKSLEKVTQDLYQICIDLLSIEPKPMEIHEDVFDSSNTFQVERSNHSESVDSVDVILFHHTYHTYPYMLFRNPSCFLFREAGNLHMTGWWFQIFSISYSLHMCWYFL